MPTNRKVIFANGEYYHIFNRGVDKRITFSNKREYVRAISVIRYYSFHKPPIRYSRLLTLPQDMRENVLLSLKNKSVNIIAYCIMPNHFHLLLQQVQENGISRFVANMTNSYTKYFNTKHKRVGPLFGGIFKAVHIEDNEQLIHLSRYIHLNPATAYIIEAKNLHEYPWSSYLEYINKALVPLCNKEKILEFFKDDKDYEDFCKDQESYSRELKEIEHLTIDQI